jgi:membrane protease YdiL (CAAX protease family)
VRTTATGRAGRGRAGVLAAAGLGGAVMLRRSLAAKADSRRFYALTAGLAGTWTASALLTTAVPVWPAGRRSPGMEVARPALTGAATFALFYAAATVARRDPFLRRAIASVLHYVEAGTTPAVLLTASVNAVAEELFFRGALWDAAGPSPLASTTLAYTAVTASTGNPALAIGGAITGVIFGRERARSGGVAAPAIAHVTWSALMLTILPTLFRPAPGPASGQPPKTPGMLSS